MLKRIADSLMLAMLVCGCVPFPNLCYYAPAVSGVITQDGSPVVGAQVFVSSELSDKSSIAVTGTNGRFAADPIREVLLTLTLIGDPLIAYSMQIKVSGKMYEGYFETSMGYVTKAIDLECNLSHPQRLWDRQIYCTPVNLKSVLWPNS